MHAYYMDMNTRSFQDRSHYQMPYQGSDSPSSQTLGSHRHPEMLTGMGLANMRDYSVKAPTGTTGTQT